MARLLSCIRPFFNTNEVFSEKKPTKIMKRRAFKGMEKSPWRFLTSSPVIQKKLRAKHIKNNFKKMVHNTNSSNSDKYDDSDCCR
jgi:nucleoside diphosphate kinase